MPPPNTKGLITKDTINQVRERADIVQEIGSRVHLKKSGATFIGLCPFHGEKSPSFHVSPARQRFHCFGCGVDGDAIEFLMQHDGMDFQEAVEDLASRLGVRLEREQSSGGLDQPQRVGHDVYQTLTEVCQKAAEHYRQNLVTSRQGTDYVARRNLTPEVVDLYGIGFAIASTDGLRNIFPDYDSNQNLIKAGMVVHLEEGQHRGRRFDRFRERLMFPIRDTKGRVIGFGGRIVHNNNPKAAKYLNSPETALFSKHKVLYGLHEARAAIMRSKQAFVVEGYMDVVAMAMHGVPNAVAAMGTAMTQDHARLLLRFTRNICFLFDGDSAGQGAAWKSAQTVMPLMQPGINITFLTLPDNLDPDEYLATKGRSAFMGLVGQQSQSLTTFLLSKLIADHGNDGRLVTLEAKANFAREAMDLASLIPRENPLGALLVKEIENLSGIDAESGRSRHLSTNGPNSSAAAAHQLQVHIAGSARRPWLPSGEYRATRRAAAPAYTSKTFPPLAASPYERTPLAAPYAVQKTLWQQIIHATQVAPSFAFEKGSSITALLNQESPEELQVLMVFDALENSDSIADPPSIPEDARQAAIDLLSHVPNLIRKHRHHEHLARLKRMKDSGEISDEQYLTEACRIPSLG